ncbi:unnamed protein product, partial [Adineta ricciae]
TIDYTEVQLLQHLIDILSQTKNRYVISNGSYGDYLKLPNTMVGERNLPQTKIFPLVDLVISHGGNNVVTGTLYFSNVLGST